MRTRLLGIAAALCLAAAGVALPTASASADTPVTLHASPDGTGTTCSIASPCSITSALGAAADGDTVGLAGGRYTTHGPLVVDAAISVQPEPGASVVVDAIDPGSDVLDINSNGSVTLAGFDITQRGSAAVWVSTGNLDVSDVTIHNAGGSGYTEGIDTAGGNVVSMFDSTIEGEDVGVDLRCGAGSSIANSTITHNVVGLSIDDQGSSCFFTVALGADLIAGNGSDCEMSPIGRTSDQSGNVSGDDSCAFTLPDGSIPGQANAGALIAALADNGGPVETAALLPGSAAIGIGVSYSGWCAGNDARGVPRPADHCDAGAFQTQPDPSASVKLGVDPSGGATVGQTVTLTSHVQVAPAGGVYPAPTGTVTFTADGSTITGCDAMPLADAGESCPVSSLPAGTYDLRASYSGDSHYPPVSDTISDYTVAKAATGLKLAVTPAGGARVGDPVTMTATVTGPASGSVDFTADGNSIGCDAQAISNGKATCTTSALAAGSYRLRADFGGDAGFAAASDVVAGYPVAAKPPVAKAAPTMGLAVSPSGGATVGDDVVLTASVAGTGTAPGGSVAFTADGNPIAGCESVSISSGKAVCTAKGLAAGSYTLRASYGGDSNYLAAHDSLSGYVVAKTVASVDLAVSPSAGVRVGKQLAMTATVSGGAQSPSGSVAFTANGNPITGCAAVGLVSGKAVCKTSALQAGTYRLRASYSGDGTHLGAMDQLSAYPVILDPTITASVSSSVAKSAAGWYRMPVVVSFRCKDGTAALSGGGCPDPATLGSNGRGHSVSRTVTARDGGTASVTVRGINIDRTAPVVKVTGVIKGHTYKKAPTIRCKATDVLSGVAKCTVTKKKTKTKKGVATWSYAATAVDRAGNTKTTTGTYKVK